MEYKSILKNESKGTWIKTVFDDIVTDTPNKSEALVFGDEHCAEVSLDYLNGTTDDCFTMERL
jgi:hypothetical protein